MIHAKAPGGVAAQQRQPPAQRRPLGLGQALPPSRGIAVGGRNTRRQPTRCQALPEAQSLLDAITTLAYATPVALPCSLMKCGDAVYRRWAGAGLSRAADDERLRAAPGPGALAGARWQDPGSTSPPSTGITPAPRRGRALRHGAHAPAEACPTPLVVGWDERAHGTIYAVCSGPAGPGIHGPASPHPAPEHAPQRRMARLPRPSTPPTRDHARLVHTRTHNTRQQTVFAQKHQRLTSPNCDPPGPATQHAGPERARRGNQPGLARCGADGHRSDLPICQAW
jgi:hypothetical protein